MSLGSFSWFRDFRKLDSTTVSLILCASFFAPLGATWSRILVFGFGIFVYVLHKWLLTLESRRTFSASIVLSVRTATLFTLLASWTWSDVTIPFLADSDKMLRSIVDSIPENVTFFYDINTSTLNLQDSIGSGLNSQITEIAIPLDRRVLDTFRLEVPQTPVVDWIHLLQSVGGYYEVLYRLIFCSWLHGNARGGSDISPVIEVTEFFVGDRVLSGGKRLGQKRRAGTIIRVMPSPLLEMFEYEVEWDLERGVEEQDDVDRSIMPATQLVPESAKLYIFPQMDGTVSADQIPRDALAVFTRTNMTIVEGFSHYYGQYWRFRKGSAPKEEELEDLKRLHNQYRRDTVDPDTCKAPEDVPPWSPIGLRPISRWKPLEAILTVVCDKTEYVSWNCSRQIGSARIEQWRQTLYPLVGAFGDEEKAAWFRIVRYYAWWLFFFSCQTAMLFCMTMISVSAVFVPACYMVVNSLRHVDDVGISYNTILHIALRTYDSLMLTYHLAVTLIRNQVSQLPIGASSSWENVLKTAASNSVLAKVATLYLRNFGYSVVLHWMFNCALLFRMRMVNEIKYDLERQLQLDERKKKKRRIVLPRKRSCSQESLVLVDSDNYEDDGEEPSCRICFSSEGQLLSPCCCDGSMRYVHLDCLSEWRFRSMQTESFVRCDQCKYRYKIRKTWLGLTLRSSLCLSIMSIALIIVLCFAGAIFAKLLDVVLVGKRANEYALGPKISYYIKEHAWPVSGPPTSYMEQKFVETMTYYLIKASLELGHLVTSFVVFGVIGFLTSDSYAVPWLWGTSDEIASQEEGWSIYAGGRIGIVVIVGHYRLFSSVWKWLKLRTAKLISKRETTLVPIEPMEEEIKPGTVLRTPFGKVRVQQYNEGDDMIEGEFVDWKGKVYRSGEKSVNEDVVEVEE